MNRVSWLVGTAALLAAPLWAQDEAPSAADLRALKAERLAQAPSASAMTSAARSVRVDCNAKGRGIQQALDKASGPVIIEVSGLCRENVRVWHRDDVTLRGTDPSVDGIRGVAADPPAVAALGVWYAQGVRLENLSVSESMGGESPGIGLGLWYSTVELMNCRFEANASTGVHVSAMSYATGTEVVLSGNGSWGLNVQRGSTVDCTGCRLEANGAWAARAQDGGLLTLLDSAVSGSQGLFAGRKSYADVDCVAADTSYPCGLTASRAVHSTGGGNAALLGVAFEGLITAYGGDVYLYGAKQTAATGNNSLDSGASMTTQGNASVGLSQLTAPTSVGGFSRALLREGTVLSGSLTCHSAGDAYADPGVVVPGQVTGCPHVP